ncbi:hypothetical protein JKP88DRAFT_220624 [Tribonema minus]|uniref:Uncharacterized protein n=1 Tax=Tribonema minus TaxID=303371 RepID=A0A835YZ22_9STRA|nr:hypothetical protein JKP88DRAFT_220624 [Tribonema minus]
MSGDDVLRGVLRAWDAYRDWCEEVDERPFIRDAALLAFRNNFVMNVQVCAAVSAVAQHAAADAADAAEAGHAREDGRDGRRMGGRKRACSASDGGSGDMGVGGAAAGDAGTNNEDSMLFTDLELVEDCRALNFSVQHSRRSTGSERGLKTSTSTAERHHRHYYDWILERVEGRAEDILRGTVDARGIAGGVKLALSTAAPESRQQLLSRLLSAVEELDVPDDDLSGDRHTQGSMRRAMLLPLLRWRAAMDECAANRNDNDEPSALLMQDIGGKSRGKGRGGGRAAAHARAAVRGCVGNAGASWKQLSNVFS